MNDFWIHLCICISNFELHVSEKWKKMHCKRVRFLHDLFEFVFFWIHFTLFRNYFPLISEHCELIILVKLGTLLVYVGKYHNDSSPNMKWAWALAVLSTSSITLTFPRWPRRTRVSAGTVINALVSAPFLFKYFWPQIDANDSLSRDSRLKKAETSYHWPRFLLLSFMITKVHKKCASDHT